jgi:hypothetical protein
VLKSITIGDRKLYVYPTLKGLSKEGEEVEEIYSITKPDVLCVSLSDRELAEVMFAIRDADGYEPPADYTPESDSLKRILDARDEEVEGDGDDDEEEGDGDDDEEEGDGLPDRIEVPAGIVSREMVDEALDEPFAPDLMAADSAAKGDQIFISDSDMAYSKKLATFGDVELPPPAFVESVRLAEQDMIPIMDIDLSDDEYTLVFIDHVTYWQLVSQSRKIKSMRKRLKTPTPEEMAKQWDARIRTIKGFEFLERERERKMAAGLLAELDKHSKVLAIIDLVRVDGTLKELENLLKK